MPAHQSTTATGPSWADVRVAIEDLKVTWGGFVSIDIGLAPRNPQKSAYGLWVRCVWREAILDRAAPERASGRFWPSTEHRTMPALILFLLYNVERKLEDMAHDRAVQEAAALVPKQLAIPDLPDP